MKLQLRRKTDAQWTSINPILLLGEPVYIIDKGTMKIGDGVSQYTDLKGISGGGSGYELELLASGDTSNLTLPSTYGDGIWANNQSTETIKKSYMAAVKLQMDLAIPAHEYPEKGYYLEMNFHPKGLQGYWGENLADCPMQVWPYFAFNDNIDSGGNIIHANYDSTGNFPGGTEYEYVIPGYKKGNIAINAGGGNGGGNMLQYGMECSSAKTADRIICNRSTFEGHITIKDQMMHMESIDLGYAKYDAQGDGNWKEDIASYGENFYACPLFSDTIDSLVWIEYNSSFYGDTSSATVPQYYNFDEPSKINNQANWNEFSFKLYKKV